jgi:hypothetical protein
MITRSRNATEKVRQTLEKRPPNEHARFFDFDVDAQGLKVTVL